MILRPTWTSPGRVVGPAWPCTGRGLPGRRVTATPVRSYRTISPLPVRPRAPSAVCFCGTFPRVSPGGRYPPPCPLVSGLSSRDTSPAIALTRRTILEPVSEPRAAAWRGRGNDEALPASASPHPSRPVAGPRAEVEVLLAYGEVPRCRRPVGVGGRSGCSAAAQRSAAVSSTRSRRPRSRRPAVTAHRRQGSRRRRQYEALRGRRRRRPRASASRRGRRHDRRAGRLAGIGGGARWIGPASTLRPS